MLIKLMDVNNFCKNLKPVKTSITVTKSDEFHEGGIFSEIIFGPLGSSLRTNTYSYIELNCKIIHPTAFKILKQLDRKIIDFISVEKTFNLDTNGILQEDENGINGINNFIKIFPNINFREHTPERKKLSDMIKGAFKQGTLFVDKIPVVPPDFRPIYKDNEGRWIQDKMNNFYTSLITRSISIKPIDVKSPFFDILNFNIQKSVNDLDEFTREKISHKYGLIRSSILGKRVDYSGRAVISCGPELRGDEIGIPFKMAISLFEPFILHLILYSPIERKEIIRKEIENFTKQEVSIDTIKKIMTSIKNGDYIPPKLYKIFYDITETSMKDRLVLAKRDPVLHPESVRAFTPILIEGNTVRISNLDVGGFNADFDGDQMAIFHPLSNEAQEDAKKMTKLVSSTSSYSLGFALSKEACAGLYILTKDYSSRKSPITFNLSERDKYSDPTIPTIYKNKRTTLGKAIFNSCFPSNFTFVDKLITKKEINELFLKLTNKYDRETILKTSFNLQKYAFKFATLFSPSITLDDLEIPEKIYRLKKKLQNASTEEASKLLNEMKLMMIDHLKDTGLYDLVESGSTKGWDQPTQILIAKGIIADTQGNILPTIKSSLSEGLKPTEYFNVSYGARKGIIDRVLNTAETGYTTRQLIYLLNSVELDLFLKDCGTKNCLEVKLTKDIISRLTGRYIKINDEVVEFNKSKFKPGDIIQLRSPIYCESPKICHTCYGRLLERHGTPFVGMYAAQVVGESGTQNIMRTFHKGGAISLIKRDILKEIINNNVDLKSNIVNKYFKQTDQKLYCNIEFKLKLDLSDYTENSNLFINENERNIYLKGLLCIVTADNIEFDVILDYSVKIFYNELTKTDKKIIIEYKKGDLILDVPIEYQEIKESILYLKRILSGKEIFKDNNHLFLKLYKVYENLSNFDLVHLEVLLSQCMRDKKNVMIPARLGSNPFDPTLLNIKKNVFSTSFLQGLAFENIGEAIKVGLTSDQELPPSMIEKILTGKIVERR
jgi:DNA-directed RNA polymerase subunit beta'